MLAVPVLCACLAPGRAGAEVRVERGPDGKFVVYNVSGLVAAAQGGAHSPGAPGAPGAPGTRRTVRLPRAVATAGAGPAGPATSAPAPPLPQSAPSAYRAAVLRTTPDPDALGPLIDRHSGDHGLDPRLVAAVVQAESAFDHLAVSPRGAVGLMQLMPATAAGLAVDDPYDPDQNLRGGTAYLRRLLDRYGGDLELALAAYNAGPEAVDRYGGVPPYRETRDYVRRVLRLFAGDGVDIPELIRAPSPRLIRDGGSRLILTNLPAGSGR